MSNARNGTATTTTVNGIHDSNGAASHAQPKESIYELVAKDSAVENWLIKHIWEPTLNYIPVWVAPNAISVANNVVCVLLAYLAYSTIEMDERVQAGEIEALQPFLARVTCAALVFLSMTLDSLDGMHARNTGQTSKLGEVLDHSLDAANIQMVGASMIFSINVDPYTVGISAFISSVVYGSQLVIYRHKHKFVEAPTNGPEAEMYLVAAHIVWAAFLLCFPPFHYVPVYVRIGIAILANVIQTLNLWFYVKRLGFGVMLKDVLEFTLLASLPIGMLYAGILSQGYFITVYTMACFRWNGIYILFTIVGRTRSFLMKSDMFVLFGAWITVWCMSATPNWPQLLGVGDDFADGKAAAALSPENLQFALSIVMPSLFMGVTLLLSVNDFKTSLPTIYELDRRSREARALKNKDL